MGPIEYLQEYKLTCDGVVNMRRDQDASKTIVSYVVKCILGKETQVLTPQFHFLSADGENEATKM